MHFQLLSFHVTNIILISLGILILLLRSHGIISHRSCPSTPQQNDVVERKNRHLLDVIQTLLIESRVPSHFWCEALSTTVYLINRPSPTSKNESSSRRLCKDAPDYSNLHIFECVCLFIFRHMKVINLLHNLSSVLS